MIMIVQARYLREKDSVVSGGRTREISFVRVQYDGLVRVDYVDGARSLFNSDMKIMVKRGEK